VDPAPWQLDYRALVARNWPDDTAIGKAVTALWVAHYCDLTRWEPEIVEIALASLTYLFDLAPSSGPAPHDADDRVVGVWGRLAKPRAARNRSRQAGFIPEPARWSEAGYDRGHFVAHSLGGGMEINFFPQAKDLNRGSSERGRRWRALERHAASADEALIFVRPLYDGPSWRPALLDFCVVTRAGARGEWFDNQPAMS
jgi:DNA/RNA non-specific endonuclease